MQDDHGQDGNNRRGKRRPGNGRKAAGGSGSGRIPGGGEAVAAADQPYWKTKRLEEMDRQEWERLCDGCGNCCLLKLEDADTAEIYHTRLACRLLDIGSCRCKDYVNRHAEVPDCVVFNVDKVRELSWLPPTCAYRLVSEGKDLAWWHPLVSGSPETVHEAGISVRGFARSEEGITVDDFLDYIVKTPK